MQGLFLIDKKSVKCDYWQFKCPMSGICIDSRRRCDGRPECAGDGADELGCDANGSDGGDGYLTVDSVETVSMGPRPVEETARVSPEEEEEAFITEQATEGRNK